MTIKYTKNKISDIKFKNNDYLIFPSDHKIKVFPKMLDAIVPHTFDVFRELSTYVKLNQSEIPKIFLFPQSTNLRVASIFCLKNDNELLNYADLFNSLEFIQATSSDCTIYIFEEWFNKYLSNFEAFEFDIEREFNNEDCTIVIVNEPKDYDYDFEEEMPELFQ